MSALASLAGGAPGSPPSRSNSTGGTTKRARVEGGSAIVSEAAGAGDMRSTNAKPELPGKTFGYQVCMPISELWQNYMTGTFGIEICLD